MVARGRVTAAPASARQRVTAVLVLGRLGVPSVLRTASQRPRRQIVEMKDRILDASMCQPLYLASRSLTSCLCRLPPHARPACLPSRPPRRRGGESHRTSLRTQRTFAKGPTYHWLQLTLGAPSRAHGVASLLDPTPTPFTLASERGFLTITGRYKGVPVSIVAIGMGYPNADFFVREVRECLNGDMVVVRLAPFPHLSSSASVLTLASV